MQVVVGAYLDVLTELVESEGGGGMDAVVEVEEWGQETPMREVRGNIGYGLRTAGRWGG